jgi:hypothetical protein
VRRHHDAHAVLQGGRLVGGGGGLALHHRIRLDDLHGHGVGQKHADRVALVGLDGDDHAVLQELRRLADQVARHGDLLEGLLVHEGQQVALGIEVLIFLLVEPHALDILAGAKALVQLGAVADVLELDLQVGAALAGLGVLDLDCAPQAPLVLDHVAGTDRVAVDLHGCLVRRKKLAREMRAEASSAARQRQALARSSQQDRAVIAPGGVRSARRRPKSVAVATVEAFDAAHGAHCRPARRDPKGRGILADSRRQSACPMRRHRAREPTAHFS